MIERTGLLGLRMKNARNERHCLSFTRCRIQLTCIKTAFAYTPPMRAIWVIKTRPSRQKRICEASGNFVC